MMAFLLSPLGKIAGAALLIVGLFLGFRIWLASHDRATLAGYVLLAEKTTAEAKASEMERQRNAASQALSDAQKRQAADELAQQAKDAETDVAIADYETKLAAANRQCLADSGDVKFLLDH